MARRAAMQGLLELHEQVRVVVEMETDAFVFHQSANHYQSEAIGPSLLKLLMSKGQEQGVSLISDTFCRYCVPLGKFWDANQRVSKYFQYGYEIRWNLLIKWMHAIYKVPIRVETIMHLSLHPSNIVVRQ